MNKNMWDTQGTYQGLPRYTPVHKHWKHCVPKQHQSLIGEGISTEIDTDILQLPEQFLSQHFFPLTFNVGLKKSNQINPN